MQIRYQIEVDKGLFLLDEEKIYINLSQYWTEIQGIERNLGKPEKATKSQSKRRSARVQHNWLYKSDGDRLDIKKKSLDFIEPYLRSDFEKKMIENGLRIDRTKLFLDGKNDDYIQLHFLTSINYVLYQGYRKDIDFIGERSNDLLDAENDLFNYIKREVRASCIDELNAEKRRPMHSFSRKNDDDYDSEENVMRSFENGTSDQFGF